ncbi:hypothetical protein CCP1ISM_10690001 [Azospirillaceae bacterium]
MAVDDVLQKTIEILRSWEKRVEAASQSLMRVQFLLDGWDNMITLWRDAADKEPAEQQALVAELFNLLPLLPRNEILAGSDIDPEKQFERLDGIQRRWVRANQDWRTGRLDYGRVQKIEGLKAQQR